MLKPLQKKPLEVKPITPTKVKKTFMKEPVEISRMRLSAQSHRQNLVNDSFQVSQLKSIQKLADYKETNKSIAQRISKDTDVPNHSRTGPGPNNPYLKKIHSSTSMPIQRAVYIANGSSVSYDEKKTSEEISGKYKPIIINGVQIWVKRNARRKTISRLRGKYSIKGELEKLPLKSRMHNFEHLVKPSDPDSLSKESYNKITREKVLGFKPSPPGNLPGTEGDTYTEFAHAGLVKAQAHPANLDFKTGFSADLGVAIIRDSFREGIGKEFFASDVFLVHLKKATEHYKLDGKSPLNLPVFPRQIHIPDLLNEATATVATDLSKVLFHSFETGLSSILLKPNSKGWPKMASTPLIKIVQRSIEGYNLLTGNSVKLKAIRIYENPKNKLRSLTLITA